VTEPLWDLVTNAWTAKDELFTAIVELNRDMEIAGYTKLFVQEGTPVPSADPSTILNWLAYHHDLELALFESRPDRSFLIRTARYLFGKYCTKTKVWFKSCLFRVTLPLSLNYLVVESGTKCYILVTCRHILLFGEVYWYSLF